MQFRLLLITARRNCLLPVRPHPSLSLPFASPVFFSPFPISPPPFLYPFPLLFRVSISVIFAVTPVPAPVTPRVRGEQEEEEKVFDAGRPAVAFRAK